MHSARPQKTELKSAVAVWYAMLNMSKKYELLLLGKAYLQGNFQGSFVAETILEYSRLSVEHRTDMRIAARAFLKNNRHRGAVVRDQRDACLREPIVDCGLESIQCMTLARDLEVLQHEEVLAVTSQSPMTDPKGHQYQVFTLRGETLDLVPLITKRFLQYTYHLCDWMSWRLESSGCSLAAVRESVFSYVRENLEWYCPRMVPRMVDQERDTIRFIEEMTAISFPSRESTSAPLALV